MIYEATKKALAGNAVYEAARRVRIRMRTEKQARARARRQAWLDSKSYQERMVIKADDLHPIKGARVLVVGANEGEDCRLFTRRGAAEVHGLDVIEQVGRSFPHRKVRYHRAGIEKTGLPDDYFDIVFSVATMEHVPDIARGFAEMARVARPGGLIFSHAAPLWQSPYGHHMNCFEGHPWAHLVHNRDALLAYARAQGIAGERGHDIEGLVDYMLNPDFFNRLPGSDFVQACSAVKGIEIARNDLAFEPEEVLQHRLGQEALALGYTKENLLAIQHNFIASKL